MKFLLVNINAAVKKIFSIASRKAGISLDFVGSLGDISMQEDYDCIFIDDGVLHTGNFQHIKNKMITTKFCLIISKDSQMVHGFDNYIRKPFLPTDIYEVLKQEKRNDMKFSSFDTEMDDISLKTDESLDSNIDSIDLLDEMHHSDMNVGININNIDLSGFDDNDDEFLSGISSDAIPDQNSDEIMIKSNDFINDDDEIKFTYDDLGTNAPNSTSDDFIQIKDSSHISRDDLAQDALVEDIDVQDIDIKADDDTNQDSIDIIGNTSIQSDAKIESDDDDDIDFSSVFAMQEEFEKDHRKPKGLIGGDIYTKKEPPKLKDIPSKDISSDIKPHSISPIIGRNLAQGFAQESAQETTRESLQKPLQEFLHESNINNTNMGIQEEDIINFDELDSLSGVDFDDELNLIDEDSKSDQNTTTQNPSQDLDFSDDFNIGGLGDDDPDSLDDEALLKIQEKPAPLDRPKILNKSDIDEVTHILESTQNTHDNLHNDSHAGDVKIANIGSDSTTQEAFGEVIDETNASGNFSFDDDLPSDIMQDVPTPASQVSLDEPPSATANNASPSATPNVSPNPAPNVISNPNLDLTEIIKSFPIDKLRELLSGVQITINITFPTKK